jgi:hypothetical protein
MCPRFAANVLGVGHRMAPHRGIHGRQARARNPLATERNASASTQLQAASAILFPYRRVLETAVQLPSGLARPQGATLGHLRR